MVPGPPDPGPSIHLTPRHRHASLAARPGRIPGIAGDVLATQSGVGVKLGNQMTELFKSVITNPRRVQAARIDVRDASRCWHAFRIISGRARV